MKDNFLYGLATLIGTIIGLGVFALPYAVYHTGWIAFIYLIIFGILMVIMSLVYGNVIFYFRELKNLPGYSESLVGRFWGKIIFLVEYLSLEGTLLAYLVVSGIFLNIVFPNFGILLGKSLFFGLTLIPIIGNLRIFKKTESIFTFLLIFLFVSLMTILSFSFAKENFNLEFIGKPFLAYGVILFALAGLSVMPEIREIVGYSFSDYRKIVILSYFLVLVFYLVFIFVAIGVLGGNLTPDFLSGVKNFLPGILERFFAFLAILNIYTTFIALAHYLKNVLTIDLKFSSHSAIAFIFLPLLIGFLPSITFLKIIEIIGGVFIALIFCWILFLDQKIKEHKFIDLSLGLKILLIIIFLIGAILTIIKL